MFKIINNIAIYFLKTLIAFVFLSCHEQSRNIEAKLTRKKMPNGTIKIMGAAINGKKQGLWISYDDSGRISAEDIYINDSLTGESINYHDDGKTILSTGQLRNGKEEGYWIIYYDKDHIAEEGEYKNGIKIGRWKYFIEEGRLNQEIEYSEKDKKIILDNHLLPPTPDQVPIEPIDDKNRAIVVDSNGKEMRK